MEKNRIKTAVLHRWLEMSVRCVLAAVFLYAAAGKLIDPRSFAVVIDGYGIAPSAAVPALAVLLPLLEVAAAFGLLFNVRGALPLYVGLLLLFMFVLGYGIQLGLDVDCGCYGPGDPEGTAYHGLKEALLRDALLLLACCYVYVWRRATGARPRRLALGRLAA